MQVHGETGISYTQHGLSFVLPVDQISLVSLPLIVKLAENVGGGDGHLLALSGA